MIFPYGSVPLRTYLPDGDIDITVLCHQGVVEDLISGLCKIVEERENNNDKFQMKDAQVIRAQVKVIKLNVKNIAVDISFNQVAGFGALSFLEQVDRLIGKEHLFKRSILLVKAWCFYEGRILGSYNGLISTYGLEIMVLYIINIFHESISGPLGVLYKFLDYFSKFDWKTHCVSIHGPVRIDCLPRLVVDSTDVDVDKLLLGEDFLRRCKDMLSAPEPDFRSRRFLVKYFNIVDPLKENNNLGRSVSKGNATRIRCALGYGAKMLGGILMLPIEQMVQQLENFFMNTLDRNGRGLRLDVDIPVPAYGIGKFDRFSLIGELESYYNDFIYGLWHQEHALATDQQPSLPPLASPAIPPIALHPPALPPPSHGNWLDGVWNPSCTFQSRYISTPLWRGADIPFQRPLLPHPQSPLGGAYDEFGRARGTGTYIPSPPRRQRKSQMWCRARAAGTVEETREAEALKVLKKEDDQESSSLDLSLEQFPVLPSHEIISPQAGDAGICFGSFTSGRRSSMDMKISCSSSEKGKESDSLASNDGCFPEQLFKLADEEEFPPLHH